jgi:murein DD-endopeptidase MepM/ murein hydrolase activator NlpD
VCNLSSLSVQCGKTSESENCTMRETRPTSPAVDMLPSLLLMRLSMLLLARSVLITFLIVGLVVAQRSTPAVGQESLKELKERMAEIQADLDSATRRIEDLRTREDNLRVRLEVIDVRMEDLESRGRSLEKKVVRRAREMYMAGNTETLEALLTAADFAEFASRAQVLKQVAADNTEVFVEYGRTETKLTDLRAELSQNSEELAQTRLALVDESEELQRKFEEAQDDYESLKKKLAAAAARAARAARQEEAEATVDPDPSPAAPTSPVAAPVPTSNGLVCPVAGPNSFIDSWGFPRSGGRTHEGTDIMAAFGTPVVAITNGAITYAGYGSSAGNWLILSGADGNSYWYMHNQENLVGGGAVSAGQQIATVGNTGNASGGPPHVHFEYHPGGGGPINPYPLLSGIC